MFNIQRANLQAYLQDTLGITDWKAIQFSMLPKDTPKGYFQLVEASLGTIIETKWLIGIGVAAYSLDNLWAQVDALLAVINAEMVIPGPCLEVGQLKITSDLQVEIPDSYINQGGLTQTTGYRTAITFQITLKSAR